MWAGMEDFEWSPNVFLFGGLHWSSSGGGNFNHLVTKGTGPGKKNQEMLSQRPRGSPLANFFIRSMAVAEGLPEHSKCLISVADSRSTGANLVVL